MRQNHRAGRGQARHGGRRRAGAGVTRRGFLLGARRGRVGGRGASGCAAASGRTGAALPRGRRRQPPGSGGAAWISYIELQGMDYTSAEAFRAGPRP